MATWLRASSMEDCMDSASVAKDEFYMVGSVEFQRKSREVGEAMRAKLDVYLHLQPCFMQFIQFECCMHVRLKMLQFAHYNYGTER